MSDMDWKRLTLGQIARLERGKFSARPRNDPKYFGGKVPFIQTGDVRSDNGQITRSSSALNEAGVAVSKVFPKDTLLMTIAANIGDLGFTSFDCACPDSLIALHPRPGIDRRWLLYALQMRKRELESVATQNAQLNINLEKLYPFELLVPPIGEQLAISAALEAATDVVVSLSKLIKKKRDIRQGMMRELLTGRTRLPGFIDTWTSLRVVEVSHLKARIGWQGLTAEEYRESGDYHLVGGSDFADGWINWDRTPYVDKWRFDQDVNIQLQLGDVLITKDGTIGKIALVDDLPGPTTLNSGVFVLRPKRGAYDSRYMFCMLRSFIFDEFVASLSAGSTISHLYQKDLSALIFQVPRQIQEQRAIADVLLRVDDEIIALERRLASARAVKTGMMQELLTGRTRLLSEVGI